MSQIRLECFILDLKSRKIIDRLGDDPLPERLQVNQLRSYLRMRFGEPIGTDVGESKGILYRAPRGFKGKNTALLVIPMIWDPESGERFSLFKHFSQLATLLADLGSEDIVRQLQFNLNDPWIGPRFNSGHLRQNINDAAARAMRTWLIAAGLASEIEAIVAEDAKTEPPLGIRRLCAYIEDAANQAAAVADPAWGLAKKVEDLMAAVDKDGDVIKKILETEEELIAAWQNTLNFVKAAERGTRHLAQLGMGISAMRNSTERIERLDRACVAVLHPPYGYGHAISLLKDGVILTAESRNDLLVEIAGILCRILIDRGTKVRFGVPGRKGGWLEFLVEQDSYVLKAFSKAASARQKKIEKLKKRGKSLRVLEFQWTTPVRVFEPAKMAVVKLFDTFGLNRVDQLMVRVEATSRKHLTDNELWPPNLYMH